MPNAADVAMMLHLPTVLFMVGIMLIACGCGCIFFAMIYALFSAAGGQ